MKLTGLTKKQVEESRNKYGSNALTQIPPDPLWKKILEGFKDPMIMILLVALAVQVVLWLMGKAEWYEPVCVLIAILLANGVASFSEHSQEGKASLLKAEEEIKEKTKVLRDGQLREIHVSEVVVGDIVYLQAGDKLPADGEIVEGEVMVDQAALNGETEEAPKRPNPDGEAYEIKDLLNTHYAYRGTVVCGGEGYNRTLVPILEMIVGPGNLPSITLGDNGDTGAEILQKTVVAVFDWADEVIKNSDDMVRDILNIIPNILYFLNADGLVSSLMNLLAPIGVLVKDIAPTLLTILNPDDTSALAIIQDEDANFLEILDGLIQPLLANTVAADLPDRIFDDSRMPMLNADGLFVLEHGRTYDFSSHPHFVEHRNYGSVNFNIHVGTDEEPEYYNYLTDFYIGKIEPYVSANGRNAFRMTFGDDINESMADLITILLYTVLDTLTNPANDEGLSNLLGTSNQNINGEEIIDAATGKTLKYLDGHEKLQAILQIMQTHMDGVYKDLNWFYFDEDLDGGDLTTAEALAKIAPSTVSNCAGM